MDIEEMDIEQLLMYKAQVEMFGTYKELCEVVNKLEEIANSKQLNKTLTAYKGKLNLKRLPNRVASFI